MNPLQTLAEMSLLLYSSRILLLFHVSTQTHRARARELNTRKSKQMKNFTEATETDKPKHRSWVSSLSRKERKDRKEALVFQSNAFY